MKGYELSNTRAQVLDQLVADGLFKSPTAALNYAVDSYLSGLRQRRFAIDPNPADNGAHKTQEQWIAFFNEQRRPMISAAELYRDGKSAPDEVLQSLRNNWDISLLVTSTRISYSGDDLSGKITQNYGSKVVKPSQTDVSVIPVYNGTPLAQALQTKEGVSYLQALLDTSDEPKEIAGTLKHLSGRSKNNTILGTPDQGLRKIYSKRAAGFFIIGDRFYVDGNRRFGYVSGHSRGMSASPRSGRAKK